MVMRVSWVRRLVSEKDVLNYTFFPLLLIALCCVVYPRPAGAERRARARVAGADICEICGTCDLVSGVRTERRVRRGVFELQLAESDRYNIYFTNYRRLDILLYVEHYNFVR